jgi:hypothetical protein
VLDASGKYCEFVGNLATNSQLSRTYNLAQ